MSEESEILKETLFGGSDVVDKEAGAEKVLSPEELLTKKIKEQKKKAAKKRRKKFIIIGVIGFLYFVVSWGMQPYKATMEYGICKTFLELNLVYPFTLHVNELDVLNDGSYRMWYTQVDSFGSNRMDSFQCYFSNDPQTGMLQLSKVKFGKIFLEQEKIAYFNTAIPYLMEHPPDLTWPMPLSDNVANLQFDTGAFTNIRNLAARLPTL